MSLEVSHHLIVMILALYSCKALVSIENLNKVDINNKLHNLLPGIFCGISYDAYSSVNVSEYYFIVTFTLQYADET